MRKLKIIFSFLILSTLVNVGQSMAQESSRTSFQFNWQTLFTQLPDGFKVTRTYGEKDGLTWIEDYVVLGLVNTYNKGSKLKPLGTFRKHCWLVCGNWFGTWEQNGYTEHPVAAYDMGGSSIEGLLRNQIREMVVDLAKTNTTTHSVRPVTSLLNQQTKLILRDYIFVVKKEYEVYASDLATFNLHAGDIIQIHRGQSGEPTAVDATVLYSYSKDSGANQKDKAFIIEAPSLQEMQVELGNRVDAGIAKGQDTFLKMHVFNN